MDNSYQWVKSSVSIQRLRRNSRLAWPRRTRTFNRFGLTHVTGSAHPIELHSCWGKVVEKLNTRGQDNKWIVTKGIRTSYVHWLSQCFPERSLNQFQPGSEIRRFDHAAEEAKVGAIRPSTVRDHRCSKGDKTASKKPTAKHQGDLSPPPSLSARYHRADAELFWQLKIPIRARKKPSENAYKGWVSTKRSKEWSLLDFFHK